MSSRSTAGSKCRDPCELGVRARWTITRRCRCDGSELGSGEEGGRVGDAAPSWDATPLPPDGCGPNHVLRTYWRGPRSTGRANEGYGPALHMAAEPAAPRSAAAAAAPHHHTLQSAANVYITGNMPQLYVLRSYVTP